MKARVTRRRQTHARRRAQAADRFGDWVLQLTEAIEYVETSLHHQATRAQRAQIQRVARLMLAAADGAPRGVLLAAVLGLTSSTLLATEFIRRVGPSGIMTFLRRETARARRRR